MEDLRPEPRSDVATMTDTAERHFDVEHEFVRFEAAMEAAFAAQLERFEAVLREQLNAQTKLLFFGMIGTLVSLAGIMIGTAAL